MKKKRKFGYSGRVRLRIKGLNQERIFNELSRRYTFYDVDRIERRVCEFEVDEKFAKEIKASLKSSGVEVQTLSSHGLLSHLKKAVKCYGTITAFLFCFVLYIMQYGLIWRVDVYGIEMLSRDEIVTFVDQNFALNRHSLSTKELEKSLKNNFYQISSVSAAVVGQSLVINIYEIDLPDEMKGEFSPIYSDFDGRVTSVNLVQGTLNVKPGQIVRKGDILVSPFIIDSQGQKRDVKPQAQIFADVWLSGQSTHSESYVRTFRTGKTVVCQQISLFGLEIYSNNRQVEFSNFDKQVKSQYLTKNNLLPLTLTETTYFEVASELVEQPFDAVKEQKIQEARQKALIYFDKYDIIKDESYYVEGGCGIFYVTYLLTINRQIGATYEELFQKNLLLQDAD